MRYGLVIILLVGHQVRLPERRRSVSYLVSEDLKTACLIRGYLSGKKAVSGKRESERKETKTAQKEQRDTLLGVLCLSVRHTVVVIDCF